MIEKAFVILAEAVVVLVVGRDKGGADGKELADRWDGDRC